jgi:hypothetical protein
MSEVIHKLTKEKYKVVGGRLLSSKEAREKDISGSFYTLEHLATGTEVLVVFGYDLEGNLVPHPEYELTQPSDDFIEVKATRVEIVDEDYEAAVAKAKETLEASLVMHEYAATIPNTNEGT